MEVMARAQFIRMGPRKVRLLADLVRGQGVQKSLQILKYSTKTAATALAKVIQSAAANADNEYGLDAEQLYVKTVTIDGGPTLKRIRPQPMGRAYRIRKRMCHIRVVLDELS
jgi:large subunit ribosomal protein L22